MASGKPQQATPPSSGSSSRPSRKGVPEEVPNNVPRREPKGYAAKKGKPTRTPPAAEPKADSSPESRHTITAANAQLLASMLSVDGEDAPGELVTNTRTSRMRREVRSTRGVDATTEFALDSHSSQSRPGSGRDIGGETRLRAKELTDKEREKAREGALWSGGGTRPRIRA